MMRLIRIISCVLLLSGCSSGFYKLKENDEKISVKIKNENDLLIRIKGEVLNGHDSLQLFYYKQNINLRNYVFKDSNNSWVPDKGTASFVTFSDPSLITAVRLGKSEKVCFSKYGFVLPKDSLIQNVIEKGLPINQIELKKGFQIFGLLFRNSKARIIVSSNVFTIE